MNFHPIRLILSIVVILCMFVVTHIPQEKVAIDLNAFGLDKLLHLMAYFTITVFILSSFKGRHKFLSMVVCAVASWGAFDELTQPMFGRTTSIEDWLADCVGIALAALLYRSIQKLKDKRSKDAEPTGQTAKSEQSRVA